MPLGTPVAGRGDDALTGLVGFFVNTLVLRADLSGDPSFAELLHRVREVNLDAFAHADVPFERVVDAVGPERDLGRNPLFQVMVTHQAAEEPPPGLPGLAVSPVRLPVPAATTDLDLAWVEDRQVVLTYAADLFDAATAETLVARLVRLLAAVTADPDRPLSALDLLSADERAALAPAPAFPDSLDGELADLVADAVARTPDVVAVVAGEQRLTYAELDAAADRLARGLAGAGVGPESLVGLALGRTADAVVAVLGVWRAGAAYLPLDLSYPAERIAFVLADTPPALVLADGALPWDGPVATVADLSAAGGPEPRRAGPDAAAYVVHTSGSTGTPKGVVVPRRAVRALLAGHRAGLHADAEAALGRPLRVAHTASFAFDAALDPLLWLAGGHELHVVDDATRTDPDRFAALVRTAGLDYVDFTPSFVGHLVAGGLLADPAHRPAVVVVGGEAVDQPLWDALAASGVLAVNAYGPTETAVDATAARISAGQVHLGGPVGATRVLVLDRRLRPVPPGVAGELYLAGPQLARGYAGAPGLTAGRFVADPAGGGGRLYRTGDRVRRRAADGSLEFLGRADEQVKIRGFRVEPGEVRARLLDLPGVAEAAVVVRDDGTGPRLVGYVTGAAEPDALLTRLRAVLPAHLVPAALVALPALPLLPNGKLDARALPAPQVQGSGRAPRTADERVLCAVVGDLLGASGVGVDDDFFALGGDSIVSIQLVGRARAAGFAFSPRDVFTARTVAGLLAVAGRVAPDSGDAPGPAWAGCH
ncbi:hypothetical protein BJF78_32430 [Pseudonocardia sp. CNS-139]|nr:hypothetical protein BJF78_32430 [Pseudonocardia sp. CNS-139]